MVSLSGNTQQVPGTACEPAPLLRQDAPGEQYSLTACPTDASAPHRGEGRHRRRVALVQVAARVLFRVLGHPSVLLQVLRCVVMLHTHSLSPLPARNPMHHHHKKDRDQIERHQGGTYHASHHPGAHCMAGSAAGAVTDNQREHAENERQ